MLFQAPQPSQRPVHFPWTEPHCWQTKRACGRGIRSTAVSVVPGCHIGADPEPTNAFLSPVFEVCVLGFRARGLLPRPGMTVILDCTKHPAPHAARTCISIGP